MMKWSYACGVAVLVSLILAAFGLFAAMEADGYLPVSAHTITNITPTPTGIPTETPTQYVLCSDYHKITDRYKTPAGYYIIVDDSPLQIPLSEDQYNSMEIGESVPAEILGYINIRSGVGGGSRGGDVLIVEGTRSYLLRPVTEQESGYREACEIV
jgi:hypothetical protein